MSIHCLLTERELTFLLPVTCLKGHFNILDYVLDKLGSLIYLHVLVLTLGPNLMSEFLGKGCCSAYAWHLEQPRFDP